MATHQHHPNRLGVLGWLGGGRHGVERYLFALHRITGLILLFFLMGHVVFTAARLLGSEVWESLMAMTHEPFFQAIEYLVYVAFVFHALNGLRLVLVELGVAVGRPEEPVFPYRSSLNSQRGLMIAMMVIAALLMLLGGFELWRFPP